MLSERPRYFRANFSTSTTPESSGGKKRDAYGNISSRIPLQIPGNFVDPTRVPKRVEMMLTKLNIPLGALPIAEVPLDTISRFSATEMSIDTKGVMTMWPFLMRADGLIEGDYTTFGATCPLADWCVQKMIYPIQSFISSRSAINEKIRDLEATKMLKIFNVEDLMEFLTVNINDVFNGLVAVDGVVDQKFQFAAVNSHLVVRALNEGAQTFYSPFSNLLTDAWGSRPFNAEGQVMTWRTNANGVITGVSNPTPHCFSIVVNRYIRDIFSKLPWREVCNDDLAANTKIPNWNETNDGDPYFYVLDTMTCDSSFIDCGLNQVPSTYTDMYHVRGIEFNFDGFNMISIVPIQSFVVMLTGVTITTQSFPINLNTGNASAALTTSVPIIEVYYPQWTSVSDLSTNILIVKDAFTNAAPFMVDATALTSRDIAFSVHYINNDGTMHELWIPPNTNLSLQICFSIFY